MARAFISDSHKDEARKDRRIAAREQTQIPRSPLTRTGLSRDRNDPAKARTLMKQDTTMNPSLILNLQAAPPHSETVAGWQVERYALSGTARGLEQASQKVALAPDDVLEIELESGTRLLVVAAEDAERYLGRAIGRDGGGDAGAPDAIEEFARRAAKIED